MFILGAPKCGTTSLTRWLREHPQVFVSPHKEPHFFNYDFGPRHHRTLAAYEALFEPAGSEHRVVCEASVRYLFSRAAVPAILEYSPEAKFVVMLRDPVDMAVSLHEQICFNGDEDELDFVVAWHLQSSRAENRYIPYGCSDPQLLQYGALCKLGAQLERLYKHVARDSVHLIRIDDLQVDPAQAYRRLLKFLAIDDDGRNEFPVFNRAKERRMHLVWDSVRLFNIRWRKAGLPRVHVGFTSMLNSLTRKERVRSPLAKSFEAELRDYFREDVKLLQSLTGWDLTGWLRPDHNPPLYGGRRASVSQV